MLDEWMEEGWRFFGELVGLVQIVYRIKFGGKKQKEGRKKRISERVKILIEDDPIRPSILTRETKLVEHMLK